MKIFTFQRAASGRAGPMFVEAEAATPVPGPTDLLVRVEAVSINPVDTKVRTGLVPVPDTVDVLGWDAAGTVVACGTEVMLFRPGDAVFYAGTFTRPGANPELHLVDERMVGMKPASLGFAEAAALPLTSLTAWQLLFDRFQIPIAKDFGGGSLVVIGGAGGVGSILIQLARRLTGLTIIATASRPDSRDWCLRMGAHHVIDHTRSLPEQVAALNVPSVDYVASLTHTDTHLPAIAEIIAPQGKVGAIDDHDALDVALRKTKSVSFHWEMVFTRPLFATPDLVRQHRILNEVSAFIDAGVLRSTATRFLAPFSIESFETGHRLVEQGGGYGKVVVSRTAASQATAAN